jgi:hypothetical protein
MFHGGTYGTYLEWCLTMLCSKTSIVAPFTETGSSHKFKGNHLLNMDGWQRYCESGNEFDFVRFHPKTTASENVSTNLDSVMSLVDRAIYIYPDAGSMLLTINNAYEKVWSNWWQHQFNGSIDPAKIYNNWPVSPDVPVSQLPTWIQREFLSLYLVPAWKDQVNWYHLDSWSNLNCCTVLVNDLLQNFESTLESIGKFCNLDFQTPPSELAPYHSQNLKLQKFYGQDQICQKIIQSVLTNQPMQWDVLPLPSEAWIQWELRNRGYEIRCHGLDIMPTNSVQLKELLYPV